MEMDGGIEGPMPHLLPKVYRRYLAYLRGVRGPEADPAAEESQGAGTGLTEVDILAAVFREGRGQLGIAEVGGDLEQTADDESQEQEQGASGRIGDLGQGREDAGANGRAYTEGNDRAQT